MANAFDQFDETVEAKSAGNPFDQFDQQPDATSLEKNPNFSEIPDSRVVAPMMSGHKPGLIPVEGPKVKLESLDAQGNRVTGEKIDGKFVPDAEIPQAIFRKAQTRLGQTDLWKSSNPEQKSALMAELMDSVYKTKDYTAANRAGQQDNSLLSDLKGYLFGEMPHNKMISKKYLQENVPRSVVTAVPKLVAGAAKPIYEGIKSITDPAIQAGLALGNVGNYMLGGDADYFDKDIAAIEASKKPTEQVASETLKGAADFFAAPVGLQGSEAASRAWDDPVMAMLGVIPTAKAGRAVLGKAGEVGLRSVTNPETAVRYYDSALRPTGSDLSAQKRAVEAGLKGGITIESKGAGLEKLQKSIDNKEDLISGVLDPSTGRVNVGALDNSLNDFRKLADDDPSNRNRILSTIDDVVQQMREHNKYDPETDTIPVQNANAIKRNLYQAGRKANAYNDSIVDAGAVKANKNIAHQLMGAIEDLLPDIGPMNKSLGADLNLEKYLEKRVANLQKQDLIPFRTRVAAVMGSVNPKFMAASVISSVIDNPAFKSRLAIAIYKAHGGRISSAAAKMAAEEAVSAAKTNAITDEQQKQIALQRGFTMNPYEGEIMQPETKPITGMLEGPTIDAERPIAGLIEDKSGANPIPIQPKSRPLLPEISPFIATENGTIYDRNSFVPQPIKGMTPREIGLAKRKIKKVRD
jgi:hypothetical protein